MQKNTVFLKLVAIGLVSSLVSSMAHGMDYKQLDGRETVVAIKKRGYDPELWSLLSAEHQRTLQDHSPELVATAFRNIKNGNRSYAYNALRAYKTQSRTVSGQSRDDDACYQKEYAFMDALLSDIRSHIMFKRSSVESRARGIKCFCPQAAVLYVFLIGTLAMLPIIALTVDCK